MRGTLHSNWLCDEQAIGSEWRHILGCKFTFTPELSTKPMLNDIYKKLPTAATLKLRKPHIGQVFDGCFGMCVHFLETNFAPKMSQRDEIIASLVNHIIGVIFPRKRTIYQDTGSGRGTRNLPGASSQYDA